MPLRDSPSLIIRNNLLKKNTVISVCGKGGVGKTCISALLVKLLSEDPSARILAIDADPAVGLSFPLGITVKKTVDDIRNDLIRKLDSGLHENRTELIKSLEYELFHAVEEKENIAFLAIGRPEGDGCYCQVNRLLKEIINDIASQFDVVIIDAEAGVEQISRRVMEMVTHLILVTDASLKGRNVASMINRVAAEKCSLETSGVIFNRMESETEIETVSSLSEIPLIHGLKEIPEIRTFDRDGRPFFELPETIDLSLLHNTVNKFLHQ